MTEKNCKEKHSMICNCHKTLLGDKVRKDAVGQACGVNGAEEKCIHGFGGIPWR